MRAPDPKVMFDRLIAALGVERSVFMPQGKGFNQRFGAHMTKGLALEINNPGDGASRISVMYYDGKGTYCSVLLHSIGPKSFAEKVWAIEEGIELQRRLKGES